MIHSQMNRLEGHAIIDKSSNALDLSLINCQHALFTCVCSMCIIFAWDILSMKRETAYNADAQYQRYLWPNNENSHKLGSINSVTNV